MAKFDAKSFNEKAFGKYMSAVPNVKLNKLRESRAVVGDARLRDTFVNNSQTGTVYAVLPFFGLLSGTPQNYDGVDNVTPGKTDTSELLYSALWHPSSLCHQSLHLYHLH